MKRFRIIASLIALFLVLIVIVQNSDTVTTNILFMTISMPRAALLGVTLLIGMLIGYVFSKIRRSSKN